MGRQNLGGEVLIAVDAVPPAAASLEAARVAGPVEDETVMPKCVHPRHPRPGAARGENRERLASRRRQAQPLAVSALQVADEVIVPRLGGGRRAVERRTDVIEDRAPMALHLDGGMMAAFVVEPVAQQG